MVTGVFTSHMEQQNSANSRTTKLVAAVNALECLN